jgi:hypothetical protein
MTAALHLRAVARYAEQARQFTASRNGAIRIAHNEGATLRQIGEAAGLSHTAIGKIVRGEKGDSDG